MSFKTTLDFEAKETKELLSKLDFSFFLQQHFNETKYSEENIKQIHNTFNKTIISLKKRGKKNKKQFFFFLEGQVRKGFIGGLIPSIFHLDDTNNYRLCDFPSVGENWAYFKLWAAYYKKKLKRKKAWDIITKIGSILAILLSLLKVWEIVKANM